MVPRPLQMKWLYSFLFKFIFIGESTIDVPLSHCPSPSYCHTIPRTSPQYHLAMVYVDMHINPLVNLFSSSHSLPWNKSLVCFNVSASFVFKMTLFFIIQELCLLLHFQNINLEIILPMTKNLAYITCTNLLLRRIFASISLMMIW